MRRLSCTLGMLIADYGKHHETHHHSRRSVGLTWALGRIQAEITPNLDQVAPQANEFMKQ